MREQLHDWTKSVIDRLDELCSLPAGWDGYGAPPVAFSNASFALSMLAQACPLDAPAPQIVPGLRGDLQVEWHTESADIELHVRGPNNVHAWLLNEATSENGEELDLTTDFAAVASWLADLSEASVATRRSAA